MEILLFMAVLVGGMFVMNSFAKKSQKMPVREKQRSLEYKKDYEERAKEEAGENNI